jgi:hypothetical protein
MPSKVVLDKKPNLPIDRWLQNQLQLWLEARGNQSGLLPLFQASLNCISTIFITATQPENSESWRPTVASSSRPVAAGATHADHLLQKRPFEG